MTRAELAQTLYETAWPGCQLEYALPEIQETFCRMAGVASEALSVPLEVGACDR